MDPIVYALVCQCPKTCNHDLPIPLANDALSIPIYLPSYINHKYTNQDQEIGKSELVAGIDYQVIFIEERDIKMIYPGRIRCRVDEGEAVTK